ncbi:MAG: hypothetical protein KF832_05680 [Caldilineaceae bacterium]|nr:hypothetical protein [Caldilineaceae bacterium]
MRNRLFVLPLRIARDAKGITALETAIILLAFIVVASVFAFTILSAGSFSTERSKAAVMADLAQVRSSLELKGSVLALTANAGATGTVNALVFTVANAIGGEPINVDPESGFMLIEYRDERQRATITDWSVVWKSRFDEDPLLEVNELAQITVPFTASLSTPLGVNTTFFLEIKPHIGSLLTIRRTTPPSLDPVHDLQ